MLSITTDHKLEEWRQRFRANANPIPYRPLQKASLAKSAQALETLANSDSAPNSQDKSSTNLLNKNAIKEALPGAKYPYQLGLAQLSDFPVPKALFPLEPSSRVHLQTRLSYFDLETGLFFGKTWTGNHKTKIALDGKNSGAKRGNASVQITRGGAGLPLTRPQDEEYEDESDSQDEPKSSKKAKPLSELSEGDRVTVDFRNVV
jgi:hypothetical protein